MYFWFRKFRQEEGCVESRLSKWLTYFVLLITAVTVVGDLITVIFTFLEGEITTSFFLEALTILTIAGGIFGFYLFERRKIQYHREVSRRTFQYFAGATTAIIIIGVMLGFLSTESPTIARQRAFDRERASDLSSLSNSIETYAEKYGELPANLLATKNMVDYAYSNVNIYDPETKKLYEYRIVTPSKTQGTALAGEFELCANFSLASNNLDDSEWYRHDAGRSCDTKTVKLSNKKNNTNTYTYPSPSVE